MTAASDLAKLSHTDVQAPITAVVVSRNEAFLLAGCLARLRFCREIIVVDLQSSDSTRTIAATYGARVIEHKWVSLVELALLDVISDTSHDWILLADPDERRPLARHLTRELPKLPPNTALVVVPQQFYFKTRPLRGTRPSFDSMAIGNRVSSRSS